MPLLSIISPSARRPLTADHIDSSSDTIVATASAESAAADQAVADAVDVELEGGIDRLNMRDHDEMIKSTLAEMEKHSIPPKTLFGFSYANGQFAINDEVRFFSWIFFAIIVVISFIFFVVAVSGAVSLEYTDVTAHGTALIIAGVFTLAACCITGFQVMQHYRHWTHPPSQKLVVRVLIMIPVYACSAWLSLMFLPYSTYIDFVRQCYEAFVLYSFLVLLTVYLGGHDGVVEWMNYKRPLNWPPPLCCLTPCTPGSNYLWWMKYTCLQYAVFAPVAMFIACICNSLNLYGDGSFSFSSAYAYVTVVINCSQLASLYALAWLYLVMKEELMPFKPVMKFLVIKSVVFFTWWQGVGFAILVQAQVLSDSQDFSVGEVQVGLQDFIVCIEMFLFAVVHKYTFGYETYNDGSLAILMEQRATYIATHQYKRAVDAARKELAERDGAKAALDESGKTNGETHAHTNGTRANIELGERKDGSPVGNGKGLKITVESATSVTADELQSEAKEIIASRAKEILKVNCE